MVLSLLVRSLTRARASSHSELDAASSCNAVDAGELPDCDHLFGRVRRYGGMRNAIGRPENCVVAHFTPAERRTLRALKTPYGIQRFLDALPYHLATTAWSPRRVLAERTAHCLEGAIFAAAALRPHGLPPLPP